MAWPDGTRIHVLAPFAAPHPAISYAVP
ncbi:MAG: hypothetical protein ACXWNU_07845 [Candidatus Binataceae bacterium]